MNPSTRAVTILLVDDDDEDLLMAQEALRESRLGNDLRATHDGEEMMDYLLRRGQYVDEADSPTPGLILLDLNMPRKDGREALAEIKSNPDLRKIPVIVLTKDVFGEIEGTRYALHWVGEYRLALEALQERDYDVCLVDYRLGAENGIQLIRDLVAAGHDLPVIVMTGQGDRDVDVEAAQSGAADYLIKGEVTPTLLERTLRYAMRRRADLRALRESEADLRQAQRMEAVGQLAGGIAHDFNNMMTAVIGFSVLALARLESGDPVRHDIEEIKRAGQRAAAMTNQLLAFSRRQVLKPRVFDLNTVVADVEKLLQRLIGEDIELVSVLDPTLQPIEADPGQLEQVIMNLAVNARDAMPAGGRLTIETRNCELGPEETDRHLDLAPGRYVMLRVTDTGAGIDTETMRRIFEPFFTTKEEGKGTGLGLATVLGIIKQSGGDIEVDSEINQGTAFRIYLPQAQTPIDLVGPIVSTNRAPTGRNMTLIREDKELVRYARAESSGG